MTPHDHNRTIGIIYGFLGGVLAAALILELVRIITVEKELDHVRSDSSFRMLITIGLFFMVIFLSTVYGLFKRRRWARIFALVLSALLVWFVPLGTALAVYTWWFMHSEEGKRLYSKTSS